MHRYRRYLWMWAAVLALSSGARTAEPTDYVQARGEAPAAEVEGLIKQLRSDHAATCRRAAEALLDRGVAAVPALETVLAKSTGAAGKTAAERDDAKFSSEITAHLREVVYQARSRQAEQLLALIRGAERGQAAGGWQATLRAAHAVVPQGDCVPLTFTMSNASGKAGSYIWPRIATLVEPGNRQETVPGELCVMLRRIDPGPREVQMRELAQQQRQRAEPLAILVGPGKAKTTRLVLEPQPEEMEMVEEFLEVAEDPAVLCKAPLPPGRYLVQAFCRVDKDGPLEASAPVEFSVAPVDWKALDQAEAAREEKQIAEAEAALEKDAALREKLRGAAAKLDDEDWQAREDASKALAQAGVNALPELERVRTSGASLEARTRAGQLLEALRTQLAEGGEPEAGLRATLHLDRKEVRVGGALKLSFEVKNVAQEARPFVCVQTFELASPYMASEMTSARAQIEIRREDGARGSQGQGIIADMEQERDGDTVELKPGMVKTRAAVLTVSDEGLMRAIELAADDAPFEQDVHLPPGRYRVRVVYYALTKGLLKDAADNLKSNWVTLDVRE